MVKYIKNKQTGKFTGSIGVGKNKTPQPSPKSRPRAADTLSGSEEEDKQMMIALIDPRALSDKIEDRAAAAQVQPINQTISEHLTKNPSAFIALTLIHNPTLDETALVKLSSHHSANIRVSAIVSKRLPLKRQKELTDDKNETVRSAIALYTTSQKLIKKLSQDPSVSVQHSIAINPNTTSEILTKLATTSPYSTVKEKIIVNPKIPSHIVEKVFHQLDKETQTKMIYKKLLPETFIKGLETINPNPTTPKEAKNTTSKNTTN